MESLNATTSTASESDDRLPSLTSSASPTSSSTLSSHSRSPSFTEETMTTAAAKLEDMTSNVVKSSFLSQPQTKKRGFDIASLVDPENSFSSTSVLNNNYNFNNSSQPHVYHVQQFESSPPLAKKKKTTRGSPSDPRNTGNNGVKLEGLAAQLSASIQSFQASQQQLLQRQSFSNQNQYSRIHSQLNTSEVNNNVRSETPSAFKKVDKCNGIPASQSSIIPSSSSGQTLPFSLLSSLYNMSSAGRGFFPPNAMPPPITPVSNASSLLSQPFSNSPLTSLFGSLPPCPPQPTNPSHSQSNKKNSRADGESSHDSPSKSAVGSSLIPFLPPSLAALSFPQTNWCAKCNASFRMTSDLVYHMRSHHKPSSVTDPVKKKREEKLRCNICGESFRERHHLTRHMTSHQ